MATVDLTDHVPNNTQHECQDCDWVGPTEDLRPIEDIEQRITPGEIVPSGECPKCGCLAHMISIIESEEAEKLGKLLVTVTYEGDCEPKIEITPAVPVDLRFVSVDPDFCFKWSGVSIYHTEWKNDCFSENFYSIESGEDSEGDPCRVFDVRDIPLPDGDDWMKPYQESKVLDNEHQMAIAYAIDQGWITYDNVEIPNT